MKHIKHNIKTNNYYSKEFVGNYVYIKKSNKDFDTHQIFKIVGLSEEDDHTFIVNKYYYFYIPNSNNMNMKCFCYEGNNKCTYGPKDEMYILDDDEFIDTFREFIKNDGKSKNEVPSKIIQDKVVN